MEDAHFALHYFLQLYEAISYCKLQKTNIIIINKIIIIIITSLSATFLFPYLHLCVFLCWENKEVAGEFCSTFWDSFIPLQLARLFATFFSVALMSHFISLFRTSEPFVSLWGLFSSSQIVWFNVIFSIMSAKLNSPFRMINILITFVNSSQKLRNGRTGDFLLPA